MALKRDNLFRYPGALMCVAASSTTNLNCFDKKIRIDRQVIASMRPLINKWYRFQ